MTLGLEWLRLIALRFTSQGGSPDYISLDLHRLGERDLSDLNLPPSMLSRLRAREAEERRRIFY